jgi:transcriptional regulator with PAS, ATPase and Fis domain
VRIGRAEECEIVLADDAASRVHALVHVARVVTVEDARSRNGTLLLGTAVAPRERVPLPLGAVIQIGHTVLVLVRRQDQPSVTGSSSGSFIAVSPAMLQLIASLETIAPSPLSVLVLGETGAGKEVVARAIHERSPRAKRPFVALNCAAFPESMVESELFGYEKGAFTGATQPKEGLIETAHGGTVFLDEIGEISPATQAKLLRVLETGEVMRLGSTRVRRVDLRFVAATNRDLAALAQAGRFREDLFFRLDGVTLIVPPLRDRVPDIAPLAESFVRAAAARLDRAPPRFDEASMAALERYDWPGNVRELRNVVERAVAFASGAPVVRIEHVQLGHQRHGSPSVPVPPPSGPARNSESDRIVDALARASGNQTVAAELLGVSRRTLIRRIEEYAIGRPRKTARD